MELWLRTRRVSCQPAGLSYNLTADGLLSCWFSDALIVTLALILTNFTPLVVGPGSSLPSDVELSAIIQSSTVFTPAPGLSASPDAIHIQLGGDDCSAAQDILATGRTLIADGNAPEVAEAQAGDVALTIVSNGVGLNLTHMVRPPRQHQRPNAS